MASESRIRRGPSVKTRPQTIRLPGKYPGRRGAVERHLGKIDRADILFAGGRRAVGLEIQDQNFVVRHRQPVDAAIDLRALDPVPASSARKPTSARLPRARRRARIADRPAPPAFRRASAAARSSSKPCAHGIAHRQRAARVRRDLRQPRQQGMHHMPRRKRSAPCRSGEKDGGSGMSSASDGRIRRGESRSGGAGRVIQPGRALALRRRRPGRAPRSFSTWPKACAISPSPRVIGRPSASAAALRQLVPGALLHAVLVLEAADIEPVAGAGQRDIEQAAMLAQRFVCFGAAWPP